MEFPPLGLTDENFVAKMMQSDILQRSNHILSRHDMEQLAEPLLSLSSSGFPSKRKRTPDQVEKEQDELRSAFIHATKVRES